MNTLGEITFNINSESDATPAPPNPPANVPAMPAPPSVPHIVINGRDGDKDETISIQGATPKPYKTMIYNSGWDEAVPIVAIVFCFGWLSIKAIVNAFVGRGASRQALRLSQDEQAVLEKLQRTLAQMESRVESLETILVETRRSKESYGTKL